MMDWILKPTKKNKLEGSYKFFVNCLNQQVDSSSTISIMTYADQQQKAALPCIYRWFLIKNGISQEVPQFKGSIFLCEPNHVGSYVQAQITSTDQEFNGKAILTLGPVQLDIALKSEISATLSQNVLTLPVILISQDNVQKQCQMKLSENQIKILHGYSDANYCFDYSIYEPMISSHSKESNKIVINFNQKYEVELKRFERVLFNGQDLSYSSHSLKKSASNLVNSYNSSDRRNNALKLDIKFINRASKDIFLYSVKAFITKRQLKNAVILKKIEHINFDDTQTFNQILQIQSLKHDLIRYDSLYKRMVTDKNRLQDQIKKMEREMEEVVTAYARAMDQKYTGHFNEPNRNASIVSTKRDDVTSKKYSHLENQNYQLNQKIRALTDQIDNLRYNKFSNAPQINQSQHVKFQPWPETINYLSNSNAHRTHHNHFQTPFMKKKSNQNQSISSILDDLNRSEFVMEEHNNELKETIERLTKEKHHLENKLEQSFEKIQFYQKNQSKTPYHFGVSPISTSPAINFSYKTQENNALNQTHVKQLEDLLRQNKQLKKANSSLEKLNQSFSYELETAKKIKNSKIQSNTAHIRQPNKTSDFVDKKYDHQYQKQNQMIFAEKERVLQAKDKEIFDLKMKMIKLESEKSHYESECLKNQKKITELEMQIEMYRKNQDVLNRSQNISVQMDNYNEEQIKILKEHNEFLTLENQKLTKACQKYMNDAKNANKLRQEIVQLKEKINQAPKNPQNGSFVLT